MITGDLDRILASALHTVGDLPFTAGTWRPAPAGWPVGYATSLAFELAAASGRSAADLAADLAGAVTAESWIAAARPAGNGYLTIEVTAQALAASAAAMAVAGQASAASTILSGTVATVAPWPDLAAEPDWQRAWQAQAEVMAGLAQAAGARVTTVPGRERGTLGAGAVAGPPSPVRATVAYLGADAARYWLAGAGPGHVARLRPRSTGAADPFYVVRQAHAEAASTLRWAADLGIKRADPGERLSELLDSPAEHGLLWLLSFFPVRVAAAARRRRCDEVPRYLDQVGLAWLECRRARPALPFGGQAAPTEPAAVSARLLLADAARAVLAAGLGLTGIDVTGRM